MICLWVALAKYYSDAGADEILVFDFSNADETHEQAIGILREIARVVEVPVIAGGNVKRVEDIKKLLYAGATKAMLNYSKQGNIDLTEEVSKRFGKEKIVASVCEIQTIENNKQTEEATEDVTEQVTEQVKPKEEEEKKIEQNE